MRSITVFLAAINVSVVLTSKQNKESLFILVVNDDCGLWVDDGLVALESAKALFIDLTVAAYDGIAALGDGNLDGRLVGIEDDEDVTPVVTAGIVLQTEGYSTLGGLEEFEVLTHEVGIAQTEGRMVLT